MKHNVLSTVIALAGLAALTNAGAQVTNTINPGDLVLGFEATGGTGSSTNLIVDLGPESGFSSINLNLNADLDTVYGTNWYSSGFVDYGLFSVDSSNTVYLTSTNTAFQRKVSGALATIISDFGAVSSQYTGAYNTPGELLTTGVTEVSTNVGAWSYYNPSTQPFATYNRSIEAGVGTSLTLYSMTVAAHATPASFGTSVGQINVASDGVISAVPEPSSYALFGFGALLLVIAYRRRHAA